MTVRMLLTAAALAATPLAGPTSCDIDARSPRPAPITTTEPISFREPEHNAPHVEVQAMCDQQGRAYQITPDTPAARARAEEMCRNSQRSLEDVGWADPPRIQGDGK